MIERRWRGFALKTGDDAYLRPFKTKALPELEGIEGFRGGDLLSRTERDSVEYTALTRWIRSRRSGASPARTTSALSSSREPAPRSNGSTRRSRIMRSL